MEVTSATPSTDDEQSFSEASVESSGRKRKCITGDCSCLQKKLYKHMKVSHPHILQKGNVKDEGTSDVKCFELDQEQTRKDLARMIILHEYRFSIVEHWGFREYSKRIQPLFNMVSQATVRNDCMDIFEDEKEKLYAIIDKLPCRVSLTTDIWTSLKNKSYFALTCHYIDDSWRLQKRLLNFHVAVTPRTASALSEVILETLYNWNVDRKLVCIVLDNCSTNNEVVRDLKENLNTKHVGGGEFFHVRCFADIVNLVVQEAIDSIKHVITKVRESVKYVKSSTQRWQQFKEVSSQVRSPSKDIVVDVKTRWDSTYLMLDTALEFKAAFTRLEEFDSSYIDAPNEEEWENAKLVCANLKFFYEIINDFSQAMCPSAYYFAKISEFHFKLIAMCADSIPLICELGMKMMVEFTKYWQTNYVILAVAVVLDPRYKMLSIEFCMQKIYGIDADIKTNDIYCRLKALYVEYSSKASSSLYAPAYGGSTFKPSTSAYHSEVLKRLETFSKHVVVIKNELDLYLEEPLAPNQDGFDILEWWRHAGGRFRVMRLIARDILSIPMSIVTPESVFTMRGRVLDQYRSSMLPSTVEGIMCTQDWITNELRG